MLSYMAIGLNLFLCLHNLGRSIGLSYKGEDNTFPLLFGTFQAVAVGFMVYVERCVK